MLSAILPRAAIVDLDKATAVGGKGPLSAQQVRQIARGALEFLINQVDCSEWAQRRSRPCQPSAKRFGVSTLPHHGVVVLHREAADGQDADGHGAARQLQSQRVIRNVVAEAVPRDAHGIPEWEKRAMSGSTLRVPKGKRRVQPRVGNGLRGVDPGKATEHDLSRLKACGPQATVDEVRGAVAERSSRGGRVGAARDRLVVEERLGLGDRLYYPARSIVRLGQRL